MCCCLLYTSFIRFFLAFCGVITLGIFADNGFAYLSENRFSAFRAGRFCGGVPRHKSAAVLVFTGKVRLDFRASLNDEF